MGREEKIVPKVMKASEVRIQKTFRIKPETLDVIERIRQEEGFSQGKIIDLAIEMLDRADKPMEMIDFRNLLSSHKD